MAGGERELSGASFKRALIPVMSALAARWPDHLPKDPTSRYHHVGIRISAYELSVGRDTDIQAIAVVLLSFLSK